MVWFRLTASLRALCSPIWRDSAVLRMRMLSIQAPMLGAVANITSPSTARVTTTSTREKPRCFMTRLRQQVDDRVSQQAALRLLPLNFVVARSPFWLIV